MPRIQPQVAGQVLRCKRLHQQLDRPPPPGRLPVQVDEENVREPELHDCPQAVARRPLRGRTGLIPQRSEGLGEEPAVTIERASPVHHDSSPSRWQVAAVNRQRTSIREPVVGGQPLAGRSGAGAGRPRG